MNRRVEDVGRSLLGPWPDYDPELEVTNAGLHVVARGAGLGMTGGALIGGLLCVGIGSVEGFLTWLVPVMIAAGLVGGAVGFLSGIALAVARPRLLGRTGAARVLAFQTSAAPFVLLLQVWEGARTPLTVLALLSGAAGAALAPLCLDGWPART